MYRDYFGFREKPFTITPNPRFIFLSKNHREAFAHLLYGIENHAGFVELTGEVGTGKTTVLRTLLSQLDNDSHRTALIFNPALSPEELLRSINREYAIPWEGLNRPELLDTLNRFLLNENREGRTVTLVIDEAQNLEPAALEQIRLISNLETETDKLIQIVLAGQPELRRLLGRPELRQLGQRITVRYGLLPMDLEDTRAYIEHRIRIAGGSGEGLFRPEAVRRIFHYAGGIPRLINIACDRALLIAYTDERRTVTQGMAQRAIAELRGEGERRPRLTRLAPLFALLAILVAGGIFFVAGSPVRPSPPLKGAQPAKDAATPKAVVPADLLDTVRRDQERRTERESATLAFNALAPLWKVAPLEAAEGGNGRGMAQAAAKRGLELLKFTAGPDFLLRSNTPAILEFTLPGLPGRRYLAVTGKSDNGFAVAPPVLGRTSLAREEIEAFWSGRGYLPWKNFQQIPRLKREGARGKGVASLQDLLRTAQVYNGPANGTFDSTTVAALKKFQASRGVRPDGIVGGQTLILLYQSAGAFPAPRLTGAREGSP